MREINDGCLLDAVLDSWDRNNTILINLLGGVPADDLDVRAMEGSPSVGEMFGHIHYVRLVLVSEEAPEIAGSVPDEWKTERDIGRMAEMLRESARAVRDAVRGRIEAGRQMDRRYDHPILMLQHLLWHEGYHHGQIKLALKLAGKAIPDDVAGPLTWRVWWTRQTPKGEG